MMRVLLFYKYLTIEDPKAFAQHHLAQCERLGLRGRILVAKEGINGSVSGDTQQIESYKKMMHADERFADMPFKEDPATDHPFSKMVVKPREKILAFDAPVDLRNTGKHLTPEEFLSTYKDAVIIDARNDYEWQIGKFRDAVTLPLRKFRDFPAMMPHLEPYRNKKVIMYCTGGIRCEKASAYLVEQGFEDVAQLSGGILTFGKEFPNTVWEGRCFVFDKRLQSAVNEGDTTIGTCVHCGKDADLYKNCRVHSCDKLSVFCAQCLAEKNGCCSDPCHEKFLTENKEKSKRLQGKRQVVLASGFPEDPA